MIGIRLLKEIYERAVKLITAYLILLLLQKLKSIFVEENVYYQTINLGLEKITQQ